MALSNQIRIIAQNFANSATLTATPVPNLVASMPVTNLQNSKRTQSFRTTAITSAGFSIKIELAHLARVSAAVLYGHNLRVGDMWRLRLWTGPAQTGALTEIEWMPALVPKTAGELNWGIDNLSATVFDDWDGRPYSVAWFGSVAVKSAEIQVISDGNPDGYVDINQLVFGRATSPKRNFSYGYNLDYYDTSKYEHTEGNSTKREPGVFGRKISLSLGRVTEAERPAWADFLRYTTQHSELFISLFPERGGKLERDYSMICMVENRSGLQNANATKFTMNLTFQET